MQPEFLHRSLAHFVDVREVHGVNKAGEDELQTVMRVRCLVNQSTGRTLVVGNTTVDLTYDYEVTFSYDFPVKPGMWLEDARDHNDDLIFSQARINRVEVYRDVQHGVIGYLARVKTRDDES